jgi:hypothetical protein
MKGYSREALEAEMALMFLARANPPPVLFRYRSPSDRTIDEISKQQIYAATSEELNDPFECRAPIVWNAESFRKQFEQEYRVASDLGDIRLIPFDASAIKVIRLGARINANPEFKEKFLNAISQLPHRPKLIQMGCDFDRFILTETVI